MATVKSLKKVAVDSIKCGPMIWERLPHDLEAKARLLFKRFYRLIFPTFEQLERELCCEHHPAREIGIIEAMAESFERYNRPKGTTDKDLAWDLLLISVGNHEEKDPELVRLYRQRLKHHLPGDSGYVVVE
jgi:hypothetical protein